jgi:FixJ family two-component response regulator
VSIDLNDGSAADKVFVVDDDAGVRRSLARLISLSGRNVETLASAHEFLDSDPHNGPACLVLDVIMPGLTGPELQTRLARDGRAVPIVFITGHGDIPMGVRAMKEGAVDFLAKPFEERDLLAAVDQALDHDRRTRLSRRQVADARTRHATLTPREREVFALVTTGLTNKRVGVRLGTSEKTIKVHRGRAMEKMGAASFADLVRMAELLDVTSSRLT